MVYHALALADAGASVDLVGANDTELPPEASACPTIRVHALRAWDGVPRPGFVARGLVRVVSQAGELWRVLRRLRPDTILVQTPPAVPTLLIALLAARTERARLVVDWHNFGWAMLALRLPARHPVVRVARAWERALGARADAHLCVSDAMAAALARTVGVRAVVLHDRPAERFVPAMPAARAAVRTRVAAEHGVTGAFALVVAPTGWTADEDVDLLLDAAVRLDHMVAAEPHMFPDVVVVATGRGPLRAGWEARAATLSLRRVRVGARWLPAAEYPGFLAAADVGVSLHRSASGVDLPMKIADLLGAGVPVCALDYAPCVAEMLHDGETGMLFATAAGLAAQLATLLRTAGGGTGPLVRLRANVLRAASERWRDAWRATARAVLLP
jgi:beta-1,4-mannosyltransferase